MLRPHDKQGVHICQAGSLDATRESGRPQDLITASMSTKRALSRIEVLWVHGGERGYATRGMCTAIPHVCTWVRTVTMVFGLNVQKASGLVGVPAPVMWTV